MRLIDADALFNNMIIVVEKANEDVIKVTSELFGKIKNAPTIDAVQVVRCKDCRHWRDDNPRANGYHCCYRMHNIFPMKESDFCSRGERRCENV